METKRFGEIYKIKTQVKREMEGGDEFIEVKVTSPHKVGLSKVVSFCPADLVGWRGDVLLHGLHSHHLHQPVLLQEEEPGSKSEILRLLGLARQAC